MPALINALGAGGFGIFYGYISLYILKRYLPPLSQAAPEVKDLVCALLSLAAGGTMGILVRTIDGVNYLGAYGLGLVLGAMLNVGVTIWLGFRSSRVP